MKTLGLAKKSRAGKEQGSCSPRSSNGRSMEILPTNHLVCQSVYRSDQKNHVPRTQLVSSLVIGWIRGDQAISQAVFQLPCCLANPKPTHVGNKIQND
jgi:hypothetical protein